MVYKKKVTLHDLADRLGLSVNTVSKALRGDPGMSERTRRAVRELAESCGYYTKDQEQALFAERIPLYAAAPKRFALIHGEDQLSTQTRLIASGLIGKLSEFGHTLELVSVLKRESLNVSFEEWVESCNLRYYDGFFISSSIGGQLEKQLLSLTMPRVLINFPPPLAEVDSVIWDVGEAVFRAVLYLNRMGHENILYIGDCESKRGFRLRWQAFQNAMAELGKAIDPDTHLTKMPKNASSAAKEIAYRIKELNPTAVLSTIVSNLNVVSKASHDADKIAPRDYSLVSLRYNEWNLYPNVSGPVLQIQETGARAAERMLWRLANPLRFYEHTLVRCGTFYAGETVSSNRK